MRRDIGRDDVHQSIVIVFKAALRERHVESDF